MGRPKGSKNKTQKSPFANLPEEWKNDVSGMKYEQIQEELAKVTKAEHANQQAKSEDPDLATIRSELKEASKQYTEATKANKLKVRFLVEVQEAKGKPVGAA